MSTQGHCTPGETGDAADAAAKAQRGKSLRISCFVRAKSRAPGAAAVAIGTISKQRTLKPGAKGCLAPACAAAPGGAHKPRCSLESPWMLPRDLTAGFMSHRCPQVKSAPN